MQPVCITPSTNNPLHFRSFSSSLTSFTAAETPSVLRTSLWKRWSNTYQSIVKRRNFRHSERSERGGVTGVGGTNIYRLIVKVVIKRKSLIV